VLGAEKEKFDVVETRETELVARIAGAQEQI